jgi:hypothetical protein
MERKKIVCGIFFGTIVPRLAEGVIMEGIREKRVETGSIVELDGYGMVIVKNGDENILEEKRKKSNMERLR